MEDATHGMAEHATHGMAEHATHGMAEHATHGMAEHATHGMAEHATHGMAEHATRGMADGRSATTQRPQRTWTAASLRQYRSMYDETNVYTCAAQRSAAQLAVRLTPCAGLGLPQQPMIARADES